MWFSSNEITQNKYFWASGIYQFFFSSKLTIEDEIISYLYLKLFIFDNTVWIPNIHIDSTIYEYKFTNNNGEKKQSFTDMNGMHMNENCIYIFYL